MQENTALKIMLDFYINILDNNYILGFKKVPKYIYY